MRYRPTVLSVEHQSGVFPMIRTAFLSLSFAVALSASAWAGPQYVDGSNFAVSGYDTVSYFDLQQSAVGTPQASPLPGKASITAEYNGTKFAFATDENRAKFLADPAKYAPQFDGHCAFGVAKGGKVPGNPKLWRIVEHQGYRRVAVGRRHSRQHQIRRQKVDKA
jgi:YHS domain-containing protein